MVRIRFPPAVSQANFRIAPLARPDLVERLATPFIASPGSATTLSLSRPHLPVTKATSYPIARGSQIPITQRAAPFYLCRPAVSSLETYQTPALGACLTVKWPALLFPIDLPEPFGLALIEAMANGTPVIAFRRGSVPEIVEHSVTGLIVDSVDYRRVN